MTRCDFGRWGTGSLEAEREGPFILVMEEE